MDSNELNEMRQYAWQYFLAHAQARLTTFRFYLVFCTILCAGILTIVSQKGLPQAAAPLAFILTFLSFVYWKVDQRHKDIVGRAQGALMFLEHSSELPDIDSKPHPLKLFTRENSLKRERKPFVKTWNPVGFLTYSECVNLVFAMFVLGGVIAGASLLIAWR